MPNIFKNSTAGSGALTVEVKKSYPRCKMSVVEKCPYRFSKMVTYQLFVFVQCFRIEQCKSKLKLVNNNFDLHSVFNTEVGFFHYSIIVIITIVSSD